MTNGRDASPSPTDPRAAEAQGIRDLLVRDDGSRRASIQLDRDRAERLLALLSAPVVSTAPSPTARERDLAILIVRLVHALTAGATAAPLCTQALTFLRTHDLRPGPLRASPSDAPANAPANARPAEGWWPLGVHRAFVDGARWWQCHTTGATMFGSERDEAEAAALARYGPVQDAPPPGAPRR